MTSKSGPTVDDALDALVSQFSSALDCYRELVQNSIDAGSPRVDVWMEYVPSDTATGTIAIHVDDCGEGMDEQIIDNELTQLFASSKEDDLTKIGKFGIGFVSIFALKPRAVLVQTGRGGEYWEVLFAEDRSFTKSHVDHPIDGTQVTLFLAGDRHRYGELADATRQTLKRWCSHSETEVTFEDRSDSAGGGPEVINEPFEVPGDIMTRVEHQGTEIVLSYNRSPYYSFHNKGLTLMYTSDGEEALGAQAHRFRHIVFKIKSRYLEHTLSRETILKDQNYDKAVALLREAADGPLCSALVEELEELAGRERFGVPAIERYMHLLSFLAEEPEEQLLAIEGRPILRTVDGGAITLKDVRKAQQREGWIFVTSERSRVTDMLCEQRSPVILGRKASHAGLEPKGGSGRRGLEPVRAVILRYLVAKDRRGMLGRIEKAFSVNLRAGVASPSQWLRYDPESRFSAYLTEPHDVFVAVDLDGRLEEDEKRLNASAEAVLDDIGAGYKRLIGCRIEAAVPDPPLFVVGRRPAPVMSRPPRAVQESGARGRLVAALNRDHPQYRALVDLYGERPEMAGYCLAKNLLLIEDRMIDLDMALITATMRRAPRRRRKRS